jgi:hypothetical protein
MPTDIPPPGPERDAEIARLLDIDFGHACEDGEIGEFWEGWKCTCGATGKWDETSHTVPAPQFSTDPAACDRCVEEMVRRGWTLCRQTLRTGGYYCRMDRYGALSSHWEGPKIADAVSAAALLALRGGR